MSNTVDILIQVRAQLAALQQTVDGMKRVGAAASEAQQSSAGLAGLFAAGGAFGLGQMTLQGLVSGIMSAATASVRYRAELEQQTVAFQSLLGSATAAQERMQDLADFAAATPFELPEIVRASRVLQALTGGALATGDGLRIVGDAAAAAGRTFDETAMWVGRLYSGLQSGTPVGEATMRLLEMGLVSGETARRLNELAEKGLATGRAMDVIRETFGKTSGAMELQSQTLNGLLSTLSDTLKSIGSDAVAPAVDGMKELLRVTLEVLGAMDRAADRRNKLVEVGLQTLRRAAAPTSESDRQEQIRSAQAGMAAARERIAALEAEIAESRSRLGQATRRGLLSMAGVPGLAIEQRLQAGESDRQEQEMAGLVMQVRAYEAAIGRLSSTEAGRAAANAEAQSMTADAAAAAKKAQEDAVAWLEKNGRAARAVVEEYQRGLLPLADQIKHLESVVDVEEEAMATALQRAGSEEERQRIRLEGDAKLVQIRRELASVIGQAADVEAKAAAAAQRERTEAAAAAERARLEAARQGLRDAGRTLADRQMDVSGEIARVDADWTATRLEKRARAIALHRQSVALLDEEIARLQTLRDLEADPAIRAQIERSIDGLKRQRGVAAEDRRRAEGGPDPYSVRQQMEATLTDMESRLPTLAEGIADVFRTTVGTAVSSISSGITAIIMKTQSWQQALLNIGNTILTTVVQSIVEMGVRWIATRALVGAANILWSGKEALAAAPKALMESISSYGVAALVGAAAFAAIMAGVGAFAAGGYVSGPGGPRDDRIMARLSNGEYVVNARATAEHRPLLDAINSGRAADIAVGGPTVNVGAAPVTVAVVNSREELMRLLESADGQKAVFDAVRRRRIDLGGTT